ncbi:MAG: putative peptide zinc metalloprotease protein [Gammaproteobacteria bacterium]|jgi:putative peptide zinc metalloprotease protein
MSESLFSESWYRVAELKLRLRSHVEINRHIYRGEVWYVIQDDATGRYHRFNKDSYCLIGLMNGRRTLDNIWHSAGEQLGDDMPSQEEVLRLLSQLHRVDLIQTDALPDSAELTERRDQNLKTRFWAVIKSPLAVKIPLLDPESFLARTSGLSGWLYNPLTAIIWLFCIGWALTQAAYHWPELTENLSDRVLATENLFLIWMVYPLVKLVHEFGHAYAVKRWGGEVHEMGVMFLIFMPVPYVDASASASFRSKHHRMLVAGAGIIVEAFIAAMAMWVWVNAEPGLVRSIAFNTMLIAGVSTLLFNGNPLLRFDAYYVLSDGLEIPNLGARSNKYVAYLCKRYLLDLPDEASPAYSLPEARWMFVYSITSFIYRIFITFSIVLFVASELFFIGIILALLSLYNMFGKPIVAIIRYLIMDRTLRQKRVRVFTVTATISMAVIVFLFLIPLPKMTVAHGVFWAPENSQVNAESMGFLKEVKVVSGQHVQAGDVLFISYNEELDSQIEQEAGRVQEILARHSIAAANNRLSESAVILEELNYARAQLARVVEEKKGLSVVSSREGIFQLALPIDPEGRLMPRGTLLGYLLDPGEYRVRVAVGQDNVEAIRNDLRAVTVRLAEKVSLELPAKVVDEVPSAQKILPSSALSVDGGGQFALNPSNQDQPEAFETVFLFELALENLPIQKIGERVYARFEHSPEPVGYRLYRSLRRLLLRELEF